LVSKEAVTVCNPRLQLLYKVCKLNSQNNLLNHKHKELRATQTNSLLVDYDIAGLLIIS